MKDIIEWKNKHIGCVIESARKDPLVWIQAWKESNILTTAEEWSNALSVVKGITNKDHNFYADIAEKFRITEGFTQTDNFIETDYIICILRDTMAALSAFDCAHMLDSDPDEILLLAKLGDPAAILIHPACIAINTLRTE